MPQGRGGIGGSFKPKHNDRNTPVREIPPIFPQEDKVEIIQWLWAGSAIGPAFLILQISPTYLRLALKSETDRIFRKTVAHWVHEIRMWEPLHLEVAPFMGCDFEMQQFLWYLNPLLAKISSYTKQSVNYFHYRYLLWKPRYQTAEIVWYSDHICNYFVISDSLLSGK